MTQEKKTRIAAATTIATIILIALLVVVIVYQIIKIAVISVKTNQIKDEIARTEQELSQGLDNLDYLQSDQYLSWKAYEQGYRDKK